MEGKDIVLSQTEQRHGGSSNLPLSRQNQNKKQTEKKNPKKLNTDLLRKVKNTGTSVLVTQSDEKQGLWMEGIPTFTHPSFHLQILLCPPNSPSAKA